MPLGNYTSQWNIIPVKNSQLPLAKIHVQVLQYVSRLCRGRMLCASIRMDLYIIQPGDTFLFISLMFCIVQSIDIPWIMFELGEKIKKLQRWKNPKHLAHLSISENWITSLLNICTWFLVWIYAVAVSRPQLLHIHPSARLMGFFLWHCRCPCSWT